MSFISGATEFLLSVESEGSLTMVIITPTPLPACKCFKDCNKLVFLKWISRTDQAKQLSQIKIVIPLIHILSDGTITADDLRNYEARVRDALSVHLDNGNLTMYGPPPPSSGTIAQFIMNILDGKFLGLFSVPHVFVFLPRLWMTTILLFDKCCLQYKNCWNEHHFDQTLSSTSRRHIVRAAMAANNWSILLAYYL